MSTLREQIESDVSAVFLDADELAETWKLWPEGDSGSEENVVVVPEVPAGMDGALRELARGDERVVKFKISVAETVTVTAKDVWLDEDSVQYQAISVGPIEGNMRVINIQRNDKDHTSRSGSGQLL